MLCMQASPSVQKLHMLAWKVYYTRSVHPAARSDCDIDVCAVSLANIQVGHQVQSALAM